MGAKLAWELPMPGISVRLLLVLTMQDLVFSFFFCLGSGSLLHSVFRACSEGGTELD